MTDLLGESEWTEAVDADIPRVDLVGRAANGSPGFLVMKQDAQGLLDPDFVRDLIAKSEPEPATADTVTMTGSPAAIARLIHGAPVRKAKYDAADLKRMAGNGEAMADESYPIADRDDLDSAVRAVGRGGASHDAIRRHILARAKALGATSAIPDNWAADGSLKEGSVSKTMDLDETTDGMDVTVPLAAPEEDAPGDPADPGSPAWEAIDAATARKWTAILARAGRAIGLLAERETLEAAGADPDDITNAWDLEDAGCAIDYAISVLAPFAVAEQSEADCGADMMAAVGKALADFDATPLDTIEVLSPLTKAGRVLSAGNEAAIRGAVEELQKVLASLPQAPTTTEDGQSVAKEQETDMPESTTSAETETSAGEAPDMGVAKADGEKTPMTVVYDQKGRLIGIVDPADVTPVSNSEAEPEPEAENTAPAADATPEATDLDPAPAAEVGVPADAVPEDDAVTKQTVITEDVLKSTAQDAAEAALNAYSATQEPVAKQADVAQLAKDVEALRELVKALEEQPAIPKVFTNGATPPAHQMRGQANGAPPVDSGAAREMKKGLYGAADASEQNRIANDMQSAAIARLQEIQRR